MVGEAIVAAAVAAAAAALLDEESSSRTREAVRASMRVSRSGTATYGRVRSRTSWVWGVMVGK